MITGGRGFVGVNLVQALSPTCDIRILDSLRRALPTEWSNGAADFYRPDILEPAALGQAFSGASACVRLNRRALIGDATPPVDEHSLPKPILPCVANKLCGEAYCHAFANRADWKLSVYDLAFIKALMNDEPIVIYGDGSAARDYIHVDDLCAGIKAALDASLAGGLRAGRPRYSTWSTYFVQSQASPTIRSNSRQGGAAKLRATADQSMARKTFGFEPKWWIQDGLASTWEWFVNQGDAVLTVETTDS